MVCTVCNCNCPGSGSYSLMSEMPSASGYFIIVSIYVQTELKDYLFSEILIKMCKRWTWLWNKTWNIATNFWCTHCQHQGNASEINMEDTFPYCTKAAWIGRFNNAYSLMHIRSTASSKVELNKFIIQKKKRRVPYWAFSLSDLQMVSSRFPIWGSWNKKAISGYREFIIKFWGQYLWRLITKEQFDTGGVY